MSIHTDRDGTDGDDAEHRFAELTIGADEFVIYDRENHQAWIQSNRAVPVEERR